MLIDVEAATKNRPIGSQSDGRGYEFVPLNYDGAITQIVRFVPPETHIYIDESKTQFIQFWLLELLVKPKDNLHVIQKSS
jgi:hypothetical protein